MLDENTKPIEQTVYPTQDKTIFVHNTNDEYGGAHKYSIINCLGFSNGNTQYENGDFDGHFQTIQFVHKDNNRLVTAGLQSEQLVIALIDRHKKLNARFPSPQNETMIKALQMFLDACKERIDDRISRNVMGDLKK